VLAYLPVVALSREVKGRVDGLHGQHAGFDVVDRLTVTHPPLPTFVLIGQGLGLVGGADFVTR
jgi:hypothetical protein